MPIVRIVGSVPEGIRDFPQELRARGFDVETVSDSANCEAGTIEITLEECSTEDTLSRVLALAQDNDIAILVSPGSILPANAVFDSAEEQIPTVTDTPESVPNAVSPAVSEPIEAPACPPEPLPVYFACETQLEPPLETAAAPTEPVEAVHQEEESATADKSEMLAPQESATPPVRETEPALWPVMEQQPERPPLPDADWVEPESASALPSGADEDSDWPIWQRGGEDEQVPPSAADFPQPESPIWTERIAALHSLGRRFLAAGQVNRILSDDRVFTTIAACSAALAILVLMVGLTARRFSPLPSRILHGSTEAAQPVPFRRPAVAPSPTTASEVIPADASAPVAPGVVPASVNSAVRRSAQLASGRSHRTISGDSGFVAKDTVIHFNQPRSEPLPQTAKKQPGVKYYTDLKQ